MKTLLFSDVLSNLVEQEQKRKDPLHKILQGIEVAIVEHGSIDLDFAGENQALRANLSNHPRVKELQALGLLGIKGQSPDISSIQEKIDLHLSHIDGKSGTIDKSTHKSRREAFFSGQWSDVFISSETKATQNKALSAEFIHAHLAHANPKQLVQIANLAKSGNNSLFKEKSLPIVHICLTLAYFKTPKSDKIGFKNQHLASFTDLMAKDAMDSKSKDTAAPNIKLYSDSSNFIEMLYPSIKRLDRQFFNFISDKKEDYILNKELRQFWLEAAKEFRRAFKLQKDRECGGPNGPYSNSLQKTAIIESIYLDKDEAGANWNERVSKPTTELKPAPEDTRVFFFDKDGVLVGPNSKEEKKAINTDEHQIIFSNIKSRANTAYGVISSGGSFSISTDPTLKEEFIPNVLQRVSGTNAYSEGDRKIISAVSRAKEFEGKVVTNPAEALLSGVLKIASQEGFKYETEGAYKNEPSQQRNYYNFVDAKASQESEALDSPVFAISFSDDEQQLDYTVPNPEDPSQKITGTLTLNEIKDRAEKLQQVSVVSSFPIISKDSIPDDLKSPYVYIYQNEKQEMVLASLDKNEEPKSIPFDLSKIEPSIELPVRTHKLNDSQKQQILQQAIDGELISIKISLSELNIRTCEDKNIQEAILSLTTERNHTRGSLIPGSKSETPLLNSDFLHIRPENSPIEIVIHIKQFREALPLHDESIGRNKLIRMLAALADLELAMVPNEGLAQLGICEVIAPSHFKTIRADQINFYDDDLGPVVLAQLAGINATVADSPEVKVSKSPDSIESSTNLKTIEAIKRLPEESQLKEEALSLIERLQAAQDAPHSNTYLDHLAQTLDPLVVDYKGLESKYNSDSKQEVEDPKGKEEEKNGSVNSSVNPRSFFAKKIQPSSESGPSSSSSYNKGV